MKVQSGFSLIEVTIILLIAGILATIAIFSMPKKETVSAESFADVLAQDLRYTQILAMSLNQRHRIEVGNNSLIIKDQDNNGVIHPESNSTTYSYPYDVTVSPVTIVFDALGKPYSATGATLTSIQTLTITSGSSTSTVKVYPETGLIE